ncbi:unnamed protein product [Closterium sp. NIES-65]|nr:unnamed protein product [Closterium sp. NIES-65]
MSARRPTREFWGGGGGGGGGGYGKGGMGAWGVGLSGGGWHGWSGRGGGGGLGGLFTVLGGDSEAVRLQGHVLTRRSRCANVRNEEDPVLWVYREALGSDMDGFGRCLVKAGVNTPDIKIYKSIRELRKVSGSAGEGCRVVSRGQGG